MKAICKAFKIVFRAYIPELICDTLRSWSFLGHGISLIVKFGKLIVALCLAAENKTAR